MVRVRFAPSPTGYLHIGGARTALFNWLYAKKMDGVFILRIEDTDELRSTDESVKDIFQSLEWLGVDWDEGPACEFEASPVIMGKKIRFQQLIDKQKGNYGPYTQMQRLDKYENYANELIQKGFAYFCYCTPAELEAKKKEIYLKKINPKYDGKCRDLTGGEKKKYESEGKKPVIRFKTPLSGTAEFNDIIRGDLSFENSLLDDFVMLKSNGVPTYNFACVVDDYKMEITHVIRGDDHLSNTPRQILLYKAFGWEKNMPKFAHLSMILGPDGTRLSKRHGHTSVLEYKDDGYLPEALLNYLALLGWSTEDSQQIFEKDELIEKFSLERCSKSPAIFDPKKLLWMSGEYIRKSSVDKLTEQSLPFLEKAGLDISDKDYVKKCIALEQEKFFLLSDIPKRIDFLINDEYKFDDKAVEKVFKTSDIINLIAELNDRMKELKVFNASGLENLFRVFADEKKIKTSPVFHAVRVATSGRMEGPSLFHYLELLGKEKVVRRIGMFLSNVTKR